VKLFITSYLYKNLQQYNKENIFKNYCLFSIPLSISSFERQKILQLKKIETPGAISKFTKKWKLKLYVLRRVKN
jgi:hypothetical protein